MRRLFPILTVAMLLAILFAPAAGAAPIYSRWQSKKSGMCFAVSGGRMVNGQPIIQWPCNDASPEQFWTWSGTGASKMVRNKKNPNFCLSVPNNWLYNGVKLTIWTCQGASGQLWYSPIIREEPDYAMIQRGATELIVSVLGGSTAAGAPIVQWELNWYDEQLWRGKVLD